MDRIDEIVQQWKRERPGLDLEPMAVIGRIQRVAQSLRPKLDATHDRSGLTGEHFDVLASLRRAGAPYELTPTQLYREMMLSSGAMTNRIDRLESDGLVQRRPDPTDRRGVIVSLTKKGHKLIDKALDAHLDNERTLLRALSKSERAELSALLSKLLTDLEPRS
jgi:DNA-binding MarR family transcriptional regulator